MTINILFGPRFESGTLMFALGQTFEPMNRFQSVLYEICQECLTAPGRHIKSYYQNFIFSEIRTWDLDVCLRSNF